jgi:hypothetical protein
MLTVYEHGDLMAACHYYQLISSEKALYNVMVYQPVVIYLNDGWFVGMLTTSNHLTKPSCSANESSCN